MTEEDMAFSKRALTEYKRIRPVVQFGDCLLYTSGLKRNIEKDDNKIIVTTIQKLNNLCLLYTSRCV